jgi:hypothetical protein
LPIGREDARWCRLSIVNRQSAIVNDQPPLTEVNMETLSTITKMQQLDAKNPGFLAILDDHLDKRKRPAWIAGKLSSRYLVAVTIQDIVDYIGEKWASKLAEAGSVGRESKVGEKPQPEAPVLVASRETGIGPTVAPDGVRPTFVEVQPKAGTGNQELELAGEASLPVPHLLSAISPSQPEAGMASQEFGPVSHLPSAVCQSHPETPQLATPVLMDSRIPKAKPPRGASVTARKRRGALLELQVALVEKCLAEGTSRIGGESV